MTLPGITDYPPRLPKGTTGNDLTLDDDLAIGGEITSVDTIQFDIEHVCDPTEGQIGWDVDNKTLSVGMPGGRVKGQLLQELFLPRTKASGNLVNGKLVRIVSGVGSNPIVGVADPDSIATVGAIGMVTEDIANNAFGYVTTRGLVRGTEEQPINTSSYLPGTTLFLDDDGDFTDVRPEPPRFSVFIGSVIRQHIELGEIYVTIVAIPRLQGLSDVYAPSVSNGQVPVWVSANSRFELSTTARMPATEIDDGDSPYSVLATDSVIYCDTDGDDITVDLVAIANSGDRALWIRNIGTGDVTIDADNAELIDAAETLVLAAGEKTMLHPSSSQWWTL